MTPARAARRRAVLAARADITVRGPILAALPCGCVVDSEGGVWHPCYEIEGDHTQAMEIVKLGPQLWRRFHLNSRDELDRVLDLIARHVADQERAAHGAGEQEQLL